MYERLTLLRTLLYIHGATEYLKNVTWSNVNGLNGDMANGVKSLMHWRIECQLCMRIMKMSEYSSLRKGRATMFVFLGGFTKTNSHLYINSLHQSKILIHLLLIYIYLICPTYMTKLISWGWWYQMMSMLQ